MDKVEINGVLQDDLTSHAFINLIRNLVRYGNSPSKAHYTALYELLSTYTGMAQGEIKGRYAFPLGTGLGKTQSVVSWLMALYDCDHPPVSVAVCASKVEALCSLKRDLMAEGVPESRIGLLHSYKFDPEKVGTEGYASLPCTKDHQNKLILLATHNRIRGKGGPDLYNVYQGKPRNLLIWDESLLRSDARWIRHMDIRSGVGFLEPRVKGPGKLQEALRYLKKCTRMFSGELAAQKAHARPEVIHLPELTPSQIHEYQMALGNWDAVQGLKALLNMSSELLRAASKPAKNGGDTIGHVMINANPCAIADL
ncbi:MAG: hypothetical protein ABSF90_05095 [Syntrophobacteraceae bacterium]|jgi:hypothetical protein